MKLGLRIKQTRIEAGLTQAELAAASGVKQQMISKLETGRSSDTADLVPLASALGVYAEWLFNEKGPKWVSHRGERANVEPGPDIRGHYPLISWVQAGQWCEIMDNFAPGDAEDWKPCPVNCGPQTFVLRVVGVSMEPRFRAGELIFVDPARRPENGSFVVVRLEERNEATFKQLVIEGGCQYLQAINPAWPGQIIEVTEQATICGVVVFKGEQL